MKLTKKIFIKNLLILILFLSNYSCASTKVKGIHPEFKDHVKDFGFLLPEYSEESKRLNIGFVDFSKTPDDSSTIGRCSLSITFNHTITIDKNYWKIATPTSQYFTMLHEMGHCVCYLNHSEPTSGLVGKLEDFLFSIGIWTKKGYLQDGCPASIMHPNEFGEICSIRHFNYYIKEFQDSCRKRKSNVK